MHIVWFMVKWIGQLFVLREFSLTVYLEDCPIHDVHPICNGSSNHSYMYTMVKLVRVRDGSQLLITVCQFATMMLAIERRPPHLYECFWRHYFRTRNIVTLLYPAYLCCL